MQMKESVRIQMSIAINLPGDIRPGMVVDRVDDDVGRPGNRLNELEIQLPGADTRLITVKTIHRNIIPLGKVYL